jgi:hypothetical protein
MTDIGFSEQIRDSLSGSDGRDVNDAPNMNNRVDDRRDRINRIVATPVRVTRHAGIPLRESHVLVGSPPPRESSM